MKNLVVEEAGYVYIYLSNEGETPVDVFFDDFRVEQVKGPVVQVEEYYPFGLSFNGYSRENTVPQDYKFNGKEIQEELGLGIYDYGFRMYDPAMGRWWKIDPLAEKMPIHSSYSYTFNNPIRFVDIFGLVPGELNDDSNEEEEDPVRRGKSFINEFERKYDYIPYIAGSTDQSSSSDPNDDFQLNRDGTMTLLKQTDDRFHRYYNEGGELIWQTNWTKDDIGNQIASNGSLTPSNDFMSNLYTLLRALGDRDLNGDIIATMYWRAGEVGWDPHDIARLTVKSQTARNKDLTDFAMSFLDVKSLGRGKVPITTPISQGFKFFTGQPISNIGAWLNRHARNVSNSLADWFTYGTSRNPVNEHHNQH